MEEDPPEVVVEETPPEVVVEEDPPRSGGGRGPPPPQVVVEEDPPKQGPEQLRSTAGQAGGMP